MTTKTNENVSKRVPTLEGRRLTVRQAAQALGVEEATVRDWVWRRKIDYYKLNGGAIRIDSGVIEKLLTESMVPAVEAR